MLLVTLVVGYASEAFWGRSGLLYGRSLHSYISDSRTLLFPLLWLAASYNPVNQGIKCRLSQQFLLETTVPRLWLERYISSDMAMDTTTL